MELYELQHRGGRYVIHEHLASATSWAEGCVRRIAQMDGVQVVTGDQCQYDATTKAGEPLKKPRRAVEKAHSIYDEQLSHWSGT